MANNTMLAVASCASGGVEAKTKYWSSCSLLGITQGHFIVKINGLIFVFPYCNYAGKLTSGPCRPPSLEKNST
jgi:hypothetical protein